MLTFYNDLIGKRVETANMNKSVQFSFISSSRGGKESKYDRPMFGSTGLGAEDDGGVVIAIASLSAKSGVR